MPASDLPLNGPPLAQGLRYSNLPVPGDDSARIPRGLSGAKPDALPRTVAGPNPEPEIEAISLSTQVADGPVQGAAYIGGTSYFDRGVVVKRVPTQTNVRTYDPAEGK